MSRTRALLLAPFVLALVASPALAEGGRGRNDGRGPVTYAVIGDTPYGNAQRDAFPTQIAELNAADVALVVHVGDIKSGGSACTDAWNATIVADFQASTHPFVYTPGDNEWTDCHRTGFTPTERLARIREVFFPVRGQTLGTNPVDVKAQRGATLENVMWRDNGVVFATVHVVGSNNSWVPWSGLGQTTQTPEQIDEYTTRNEADIRWLDKVFDAAEDGHARAVVLFQQADMWDPAFTSPADYDHFTGYVQALAKEARGFRKTVLLLNGDSHQFVDDTPLAADQPAHLAMYGLTRPVPNLHRLTVNGSDTDCQEWLELTLNPGGGDAYAYLRHQFAVQAGVAHPALCPSAS